MKKSILQQAIAFALSAGISAAVWAAGSDMDLKTDTDKQSYALGYQIGSDFQRQQMDLNDAAMLRGIADARSGGSALMSEESMRSTLIELKHKVTEQGRTMSPQERSVQPQNVKRAAIMDVQDAGTRAPHARRSSAKTTEGAREFLEKNAQQEGMVTLPSGVQYRVLKEGGGKQPQQADTVSLIYRGTLINGSEFGNTDQEGKPAPKVFPLASLVPGMREAISHMNEGAKWRVFVPPQFGFDASTPLYRKITVFDIELVAVNP